MGKQVESQSIMQSGGSSLESALLSYSDLLHQDLSRSRFAEEREWYEEALFYQRRQWLRWNDSNKRWSVIKQNPDKPRPMPVTNHFARTINANANQLGGGDLKYTVIPNDDSDKNQRGAQYAERAITAIDDESGFALQRGTLAKHVALWGMGVTVDTFNRNASEGVTKVPVIQMQQQMASGCMDCGFVSYSDAPMGQCSACASPNQVNWQAQVPQVTETKEFVKGKICTEVRPIFEFFLPRDCVNPNLARKMQRRWRMPLSEAKQCWGEQADELKAEDKQETPQIYMDALRSLVNYNYLHDDTGEQVSVTATWVQWDQLPDELQELIEEAVQSGPNPDDEDDEVNQWVAPDEELDPVEQLHQWGIYMVCGGGKVLDCGINPNEGETPYTFFPWECDPANVYCKGQGADLIPLQRRLNRLDSLIELCAMSNAAGKWLWPTTQTHGKPTGSPTDVIEYDPIGDGKVKPEFVLPTPFHTVLLGLREQIKQDILEIGMTEGVNQGQNPQGVTAFRGLAYLGAKADEQISTQRYLWESAHELRHRKCLTLAKSNWDDARKVKVAGYNGKWGMQQICGEDLEGDYTVTVVQGSSRPKTPEDKASRIAMLLQGGLIDPTDPATREYIMEESGLDRLDLADMLQYQKAQRDLDKVIRGEAPLPVPAINLMIFLIVFNNFSLTDQFEELDQPTQQRVLGVIEMMTAQVQQQQMQQQQAQMRSQLQSKLGGAMANHAAKQQNTGLDGIPGQTTTPEASGAAAMNEGNTVASAIP